jgi:hypothetical protein
MNTYQLKLKDLAWIYHELQYEHSDILNQEEHIEKVLPAQLRDDISGAASNEFYNGDKCKNADPTYPVENPDEKIEVVLDKKRIVHLLLRRYLGKQLDDQDKLDMEDIMLQQSRLMIKKAINMTVPKSEDKPYDERVEEAKARIREAHGPDIDVYSTREMEAVFEPISFASPFIVVKRRSDGAKSTL